jgi:anti-sigma regulatory factor (Ser/Thr protein kinase)
VGREGSPAPVGGTSFRLDATTAAPARARGAVTRWGEEVGLDDALLVDLRMLVTELVTNAVRHAEVEPADGIELGVEYGGETVRVRVRDGGEGFDEFLPIPSADAVSGRGLYLVHRVASAWGVDLGPPFGVWFELERR